MLRFNSTGISGVSTSHHQSSFHGNIIGQPVRQTPNLVASIGARPLFSNPIEARIKIGYGKKWEHYKLNKNGKPIRIKMHVKKGDTVIIITGSDRGKVGEITKIDRKTGKVWMEGANMKMRYEQAKNKEESGSTYMKESPIHHSNVMHYSKEKQVRSRIGKKFLEDGRKVRYLKKTGEIID